MTLSAANLLLVAYALLHGTVLVRVLAVSGKEPASRAAWALVLLFVPLAGVVLYALFGEPWVPRRVRRRYRAVGAALAAGIRAPPISAPPPVPDRFAPLFHAAECIAGSATTTGNRALLPADAADAIARMLADFEAAATSIEVSFYIWLTDATGRAIAAALMRAARRGVACRVIADGIGARAFLASPDWAALGAAGVERCTSLRVELALGHRLDLRNHRKIVVIDDAITWCGSRNAADPEFRVKPRYAPWVDLWMRFTGPVARQNRRLFASDWLLETGATVPAHLLPPPVAHVGGFPAIAFGTGPLAPPGAMSGVFVALLHAARSKVVITTPYFVPDPPLLAALLACARRGVATTLILPARNDSWLIGAISKAWYGQLVAAGVAIHEFTAGLLHAKTVVVDGEVVLLGSANMDRRSLELNLENNILLHAPEVAAQVRQQQNAWLANCRAVDAARVANRPLARRIADNLATMLSPLL